MNQSSKIAYGAMLLAVYMLMLMASLFLPFLMIVSLFILPLPFILYARRFGGIETGVFYVASLLVSALVSLVYALPLTLLLGLGGLLIGDAMHKKKHPYEVLSRGAAGFIIGFVLTALLSQLAFDVNLVTAYEEMLDESYEISEGIIEGILNQELTKEQKEFQRDQLQMIKDILPAIIALVAALIAWVSQWVSYKWLNRQQEKRLKFPPFREFRLPSGFIWIFLLALIIEMVQVGDTTAAIGIANVIILVKFLVILHGLSFIFYAANIKKWSKAIPIIILIIALVMPIILFFIQLLGIIDLGFRLRDRLSQK